MRHSTSSYKHCRLLACSNALLASDFRHDDPSLLTLQHAPIPDVIQPIRVQYRHHALLSVHAVSPHTINFCINVRCLRRSAARGQHRDAAWQPINETRFHAVRITLMLDVTRYARDCAMS